VDGDTEALTELVAEAQRLEERVMLGVAEPEGRRSKSLKQAKPRGL
jgi:hypothetical protein